MNNILYNVYSEFNLSEHVKTYKNYLEVIIHPDGSIHYAVPSHQYYLVEYLMKLWNCSKEDVELRCPQEYYFDYLTWLLKCSHCISVWTYNIQYDNITPLQKRSLKLLKNRKAYLGDLPF